MSPRVLATMGFQAALAAVALVWRDLQGASAWHDGSPLGTTHAIAIPLGVSLGALVGVGAVWGSRHLARTTPWGRGMHASLREAVLELEATPTTLALVALATAVGEELLFRGALLPTLRGSVGAVAAVVLSSVAFGALHVPSTRRLVPWTLMAGVMGVVFALLYLATGELLAPIAAHAVVNYENLHFLLENDLRPVDVVGPRRSA